MCVIKTRVNGELYYNEVIIMALYVRDLTPADVELLKGWKNGEEKDLKHRSTVILLSGEGYRIPEISKIVKAHPTNLRKWVHRFNQLGPDGLVSPRSGGPPPRFTEEQKDQIAELKNERGIDPFVAVRSSVSVKDSDITSFPGMMDTYHFIKGEEQIVEYIRDCWASLYTARALYRRHQQDIPQDKGVIAPLVQRMVNSDVAGVMFTANPITSNRKEIVIESNWGLGESLVSGEAIVDYFVMSREFPVKVKVKKVRPKNIKVTIDKEKGAGRKTYKLTGSEITDCTLSDEQLCELAQVGLKIEKVFD